MTDAARCDLCSDQPSAQELYLHAKCHLTAPLLAIKDGSTLILKCYIPECGREVARFTLADAEQTAALRAALEGMLVRFGHERWSSVHDIAAVECARRALLADSEGHP